MSDIATTSAAGEDRERRKLERRFVGFLHEQRLIPAGSLVIVACSGGPDSTALLCLLQAAAARDGFSIEAAYFDHMIRAAAERTAERATVQSLASALGLPLHEGACDVPAAAKEEGRSLEDQARVARYRFLREVALSRSAGSVAVGHTGSDQVETVLLHLIRGSGIAGLAGMAARQPWVFGPGPLLLRPLLNFTRSETEAYCRLRGLTPHLDSQNSDPAHTRNRVRAELLPLLRDLQPAADAAVLRLSRAAAEQQALLERLVAAAPRADVSPDGRSLHFRITDLASLSAAVRHELFRQAFAQLAGDPRGLGDRHLTALSRLLTGAVSRRLDLPRGVLARAAGDDLFLELGRAGQPEALGLAPSFEAPLEMPGQTRAGPWLFTARWLDSDEWPPVDARGVILDGDRVSLPLLIRTRRPGDRIQPEGLLGHKKLQDLFVDAKLPRTVRDAVPLVCSRDTILWVAGVRLAAGIRASQGTAHRLHLSLRPAGDVGPG